MNTRDKHSSKTANRDWNVNVFKRKKRLPIPDHINIIQNPDDLSDALLLYQFNTYFKTKELQHLLTDMFTPIRVEPGLVFYETVSHLYNMYESEQHEHGIDNIESIVAHILDINTRKTPIREIFGENSAKTLMKKLSNCTVRTEESNDNRFISDSVTLDKIIRTNDNTKPVVVLERIYSFKPEFIVWVYTFLYEILKQRMLVVEGDSIIRVGNGVSTPIVSVIERMNGGNVYEFNLNTKTGSRMAQWFAGNVLIKINTDWYLNKLHHNKFNIETPAEYKKQLLTDLLSEPYGSYVVRRNWLAYLFDIDEEVETFIYEKVYAVAARTDDKKQITGVSMHNTRYKDDEEYTKTKLHNALKNTVRIAVNHILKSISTNNNMSEKYNKPPQHDAVNNMLFSMV